jgi:FixJ family two-component response regulator
MTSPERPWVLIVDDDAAVRVALQNLLTAAGFRVGGLASGADLLDDPRLRQPCCVVMDVQMPGLSGLEVQSALEGARLEVPIVFLTAHGSVSASVRAMKRGADDFLEKPADPQVLIEAVTRAVARGAEQRQRSMRVALYRSHLDTLTQRERSVLDRLVRGLLNKQIAADLEIAERTVKFHRANVLRKMNAGSTAELARMVEQLETSAPETPENGPGQP